jgi:hypothetical protein
VGAQARDRVAEFAGAKLRSVVGGDVVEFPAGGGELAATRCTSARVCRERGFRSEVCSSAQVKAEATSIAVYCQTVPLVPDNRPP